jgi:hypothetical protein
MALIRRIQRVYNADVVAIRYDNEKKFGNDLINSTEELGMLYEPAPAHTKDHLCIPEPPVTQWSRRFSVDLTLTARIYEKRLRKKLVVSIGPDMEHV